MHKQNSGEAHKWSSEEDILISQCGYQDNSMLSQENHGSNYYNPSLLLSVHHTEPAALQKRIFLM